MTEWWNKHNPDLPAMNKQQIGQIEDITGKIPLFLKFLLESNHKNFKGALEHLNQKIKFNNTKANDEIFGIYTFERQSAYMGTVRIF